jgi:hypothetical protein
MSLENSLNDLTEELRRRRKQDSDFGAYTGYAAGYKYDEHDEHEYEDHHDDHCDDHCDYDDHCDND